MAHRIFDDARDLVERETFGALPRCGHGGHGIGVLLHECVERLDADGGEREEVMVAAAFDEEGVATVFARPCDRGYRVVDRHVPWQPDALGDRQDVTWRGHL